MADLGTKKSWIWAVAAVAVLAGGAWWWQSGGTTVVITGEATLSAVPDEYQFNPSYESKHADQQVAKEMVTKAGNEVVAKLKELGVAESKLHNDVTAYQDYNYQSDSSTPDGYVATYTITATVTDAELAERVQTYLAGTPAIGSVTPYSTFSDARAKELERTARTQALEDAQQQAQDTAKTLGVRIIRIESIGSATSTPWDGDGPIGMAKDTMFAEGSGESTSPDFVIGDQEVSYTIQVVYRVR